jgi:CubicO group peptidase (beta-lactamase class C family)
VRFIPGPVSISAWMQWITGPFLRNDGRMTDTKPLPDAQSIREALAYFDSFLAFRQEFSRIPGIQAAVFVGDQVALSAAHGRSDVEADVPLTTSHLFRIASHSKTFTATAIFQLVESGRLRLDDTADSHVRWLAGSAAGALTVGEMLGHASGLYRDGLDGDFWQLTGPFPDPGRLRETLLQAEAAVIPPNERFKYSNIAYSLLGLIIESVTGGSYAEAVTEGIIDRLGLKNIGPEYDSDRSGDYATGYSSLAYSQKRSPIDHVDTRAMASATGFYANAADLVTYFSAHFLGDGRLLSDASKRRMQHPGWKVGSGDLQYGLGLAVTTVGGREMVGHGGGYPGHITNSVVDTHAGLAVSVLTNCIDGPAEVLAHTCVKLIDLAGGKSRGEDAGLARFVGRYASLWGVVDIALLGGRLYQTHPTAVDVTADAAELERVDDQTLRVAGGGGYESYGEHYRFAFHPDGRVRSMRGGSATTMYPLADYVVAERVALQ